MRSRAVLMLGVVGALLSGGPAGAQPALPGLAASGIERLSLDSGIRVVVARRAGVAASSGAGGVGVALALAGGLAAEDAPHFGATAAVFGSSAFRGDLSPEARAALLSSRGATELFVMKERAALRTVGAPADELPLALFLVRQSLRAARWDEASAAKARASLLPGAGERIRTALYGPLAPTAQPAPRLPLADLLAWDRQASTAPAVLAITGGGEPDHVAELVHRYLDGLAPRSPLPPAIPPARPAIAPLSAAAFALIVSLRLEGPDAARAAIRAAFEAFVEARLMRRAGLAPRSPLQSGILTIEPIEGADEHQLLLRLGVADGAVLAAVRTALEAELGRFALAGPTQAELAAAYARLATRDEGHLGDPAVLAGRLALAELEGDARRALLRPKPVSRETLLPWLAPAFAQGRLSFLEERPAP